MFQSDSWQEIAESLKRHKLRTGLTAFGVFWGIFMLVNLMGAGTGLKNGAMANLGSLHNAVFLWSNRPTSIPYRGLSRGRYIRLTDDDVIALRNQLPGVSIVTPRNGMGGQLVSYQSEAETFEFTGLIPAELYAKGYELTMGRFLNEFDQQEARRNIVIGERVHEVLFGEKDPIGKQVSIMGLAFTVVGVIRPSALNNYAQRDQAKIFFPHNTLRKTFNQRDHVHSMMLVPKEGVDAYTLEKKVVQLIKERHKVHPKDQGVIRSYNVQKDFDEIQNLFGGIATFSWVVAIGTIIAGVVGVGNIMLITVKERTREIGIRKALGATPQNIIGSILHETLLITLVAGYSGLVAGVACIEFLGKLANNAQGGWGTFINPEIHFSTALSAIIVLIFAGCLAAYFPARKAAAVDPVIALQDE